MAESAKVLEDALALPPKERARIAHRLLDSLDDADEDPAEVEAAWAVEIERRVAEVESGQVEPVPFDEAMDRVREAVKAVRNG